MCHTMNKVFGNMWRTEVHLRPECTQNATPGCVQERPGSLVQAHQVWREFTNLSKYTTSQHFCICYTFGKVFGNMWRTDVPLWPE